jgi:ankyrin repeat protein
MVEEILEAGADVDAVAFGPYRANALEAASNMRNSLNERSDVSDFICKMLLAAGAGIASCGSNTVNHHRATELREAVGQGDILYVTQTLDKHQRSTPEILSESNALVVASLTGDHRMVKILLEKGTLVDRPSEPDGGITPLQAAMTKGNLNVANLLLKWKARVEELGPRGTALHIAVKRGDSKAVELLFGPDIRSIVNLLDPETRRSPLQMACTLPDTRFAYKIADLLFKLKASADVSGFKGNTALQDAVWNSHSFNKYNLVRLLIGKGANLNAPSAHRDGRTALQIAVSEDNFAVVQTLLNSGADVNFRSSGKFGKTALQAAVERAEETGDFKTVEILLEKGADVNAGPAVDGGRTALQVATCGEHENLALMKLLMKWGAHVNAPAGAIAGLTALQGAVIRGHTSMTLALLRAGADVNAIAARFHGWTAFEGASMFGRLDLIYILLDAGADGHLPPRSRYTGAVACAKRNHHFVIAEFLEERRHYECALDD